MLTVKEAAKKLCVDPQTVRNYIRNGVGNENEKLPAIKVAHGRLKQYRIKQEDLENYKKKWLSVNKV